MTLHEASGPADTGAAAAGPSAHDCLLSLPDVLQRLRMSKSFLYGLIRAGDFPPPIKSGRASRWLASDAAAYIAAIAANRANTTAAPEQRAA
jgi:predicted DNA-binding transcriptional regulator AlpA